MRFVVGYFTERSVVRLYNVTGKGIDELERLWKEVIVG
jgi:hypothetical protein